MIFWNSEEKNNNNVDVCRVAEGLKKQKMMPMGVQGREKQKKKRKKKVV